MGLIERIRAKHKKDYREAQLQGVLLGTRQTVLHLMELRFGPLSDSVRAHVESLSRRDLDKIADGILTAGSLREMGLE